MCIRDRDGGNLDPVRVRGMLPSGAETDSVSIQVLSDERVRKIYSLLNKMPQPKAAEIVSKSFDNSFSKLQALARTGKGDGALSYGLHAKLWLSQQFETRENFNRRFSNWNDWYVDRLVGEKYLTVNKQVPAPIRKMAFARYASPEMLMYLNLALTDQVENGTVDEKSEFALSLKDCLLYTSPSPRDATLSRMPSSA